MRVIPIFGCVQFVVLLDSLSKALDTSHVVGTVPYYSVYQSQVNNLILTELIFTPFNPIALGITYVYTQYNREIHWLTDVFNYSHRLS